MTEGSRRLCLPQRLRQLYRKALFDKKTPKPSVLKKVVLLPRNRGGKVIVKLRTSRLKQPVIK